MKPIDAIKELVEEFDCLIMVADGFDDAIIGVTEDFRAVYSRQKCIEVLERDMPYEDAVDYFEFNVEGAYMGERTPLFINIFENVEVPGTKAGKILKLIPKEPLVIEDTK